MQSRHVQYLDYDSFLELLLAFEEGACRNPRAVGEPHPTLLPKGRFWVYETPPVARLPRVFILYEIDDDRGVVTLWNIEFPG